MMNALKEAASAASNYFSPETERKNQENENQESAKNIDEFLTRHFNTRFIKLENANITPEEKLKVLSELNNIDFYQIIPGNLFASEKSTIETVKWLSNNVESNLYKTLKQIKPDSPFKKFLPISILKLSNFTFSKQNIQKLANFLRHNETIKEVYLDNCAIDD
ncbi:MAG: hypothetical protein ACIPMY_04810, partial [Rickettsia endosymbiont of Pentastiridius leporinus]